MTYKVGPKGQVVIPKEIRDVLGIEPGDRVDVRREDEQIVIRRQQDVAGSRRERITRLRGMLAHHPGGGTEDLLAARRKERELEERKTRSRLGDHP
jgi:antitoxin PrlF